MQADQLSSNGLYRLSVTKAKTTRLSDKSILNNKNKLPRKLLIRLSILLGCSLCANYSMATTLVNNSGQSLLVSNGLLSNGPISQLLPGQTFTIPDSWGDSHQVYAIIKLNGLALCGNQYGVAKIPTTENQEISSALTCINYTNNLPVPTTTPTLAPTPAPSPVPTLTSAPVPAPIPVPSSAPVPVPAPVPTPPAVQTPTPAPIPAGSVLLPYVQINVDELDTFYWYKGQASLDNSQPISTVSSYFPLYSDGTPASSYSLSGNASISSYLSFGSNGQLFLTQPLTKNAFASISKNCQQINNDPNKLTCNLQVTATGGLYGNQGNLPIILYAGLRPYNIQEMIRDLPAFDGLTARPNRWDKDNNVVNQNQPYYMEVSAQPADFSSNATIVDLHKYFYSPTNTEKFNFDASYLNKGVSTSCNIVRITGIDSTTNSNQPSCVDSQFNIDSSGNLIAHGLTQGIYQINVKATENSEQAWQTFYINVANNNPALSAWRAGNVASTNLTNGFSSIYVYSTQDPDKATGWPSDYTTYGKDLSHINKIMEKHPIKTALAEIMNMNYTFVDSNPANYKVGFWKLTSNANPESQVTASGIATNRSDSEFGGWIGQLVDPQSGALASQGIGLTLNYAFDNNVKADLIGYNAKQQDIIADALVHPVLYATQLNSNYKVDGLAMDLEAGFNQINAVETFKKVADRLAYHGKWFNYFFFSDMFNPLVVSAFGPLGVANFSTYDVGQYRAPQNNNSNSMLAYTDNTFGSAFSQSEAGQIYSAFSIDSVDTAGGACNHTLNNNGASLAAAMPASYCSLSLNDSISENNRRFMNTYHTVSTHDAMIYFDGKYSPIVPLAASATEWNNVEIWNPDFTIKTGSTAIFGVMINNQACTMLTNQYLSSHATDLENPSSVAYQQLASCLQNNVKVGPVAVQNFGHCGTKSGSTEAIPYSQCILVSNIPGKGKSNSDVIHPTVVDYAANNLSVYQDTASHQAGYSVFALETPAAATSGAFGVSGTPNKSVQEPWYIGYSYTPSGNSPYDPQYSATASENEWQAFAKVLN